MKRKAAPALIAFASVAALSFAPAAHADESTYLQQVLGNMPIDIGATNSQLLKLGYAACNTMQASTNSGLSVPQARSQADKAVTLAVRNMGLQPDLAGTMIITQEAERHLC